MNNNNYETDICIRNDMLLENAESLAGYKTGPTHLFWKKWKSRVGYFEYSQMQEASIFWTGCDSAQSVHLDPTWTHRRKS